MITLKRIILFITAFVCLSFLFQAGDNMLKKFNRRNIGVAVTKENRDKMAFPAFSFCFGYFDNAQLMTDYPPLFGLTTATKKTV